MKTDQCFVLTIVIFIVGLIFGSVFLTGYLDIKPEAFVPALATLVAAFIGAWAAFMLEDNREKQKIINQNVAYGNEVLTALADNASLLNVFRDNYIEEFRDDPHNWLKILPPPYKFTPNLDLNALSLSFLCREGDANIMLRVSKEQYQFKLILELINKRSLLHDEKVQPMFEKMNFSQGDDIPLDVVEIELGPRYSVIIPGLTRDMIRNIDHCILSHIEAARELRKELLKIYPKEKIVEINPR